MLSCKEIHDSAGEVNVGSFLTFEKMLKGIAIICQDNFEDNYEQDAFCQAIYLKCASFDDNIKVDIEDVWDLLDCSPSY